MSDDLTLTVAGRALSGWQAISVTAGIEKCPRSFSIAMTERFPGEIAGVVMQAGDACTVRLGGDLVLNGFVDRWAPQISAGAHSIQVVGRGKCQDLVDASAEWPNGQISGSTVLGIAQKLAGAYGISVAAASPEVGPPIPQFNLILTESAFEVIEKICRFRGLLAYELADGSLFLSQVGTAKAASGLAEGQNVESARIVYAADQRFSEYIAYNFSMDTLGDLGGGDNTAAHVTDPNVKRNRKLHIIAEASGEFLDMKTKRALWEAARRAGRSRAVTATVDSWRDGAGALWQPNTLVPVQLPALKLPNETLAIADVTFRRDEKGTRADLLLMPPSAFLPEPVVLDPALQDIPAAP